MSQRAIPPVARRYVAWLGRHQRAIFAATAAIVAASIYLAAFHLPLHADLSDLLPQDIPAIRDLRRLESRLVAKDAMVAVVVSADPQSREAVASELVARISALDPKLVARVQGDDLATRRFVRGHRYLYVPLADLERAESALAAWIALGKPPGGRILDEMLARAHEAEAKLDRSAFISADGHMQAIVIETAFRATDVARDRALQDQLEALAAPLRANHPDVTLAFTGSNPATLVEHDSLVHGMLLSSLVTGVLVALVLFVHLRSPRVLVLLVANITAATVVAFGIAAVTVGHLNAATAFLGAIIAGNGINYGILLIARYLEERREAAPADAMASAIAATLQPTLVASFGAAIAYGALAVTRFAGFAEFAIIGSTGMLVCWVASFVVLPALVLQLAASARAAPSPVFGRMVIATFGFRRPGFACAIAGALALASVAVTVRYVAHDPFEYDMTRLRSDSAPAIANRSWMKRVNDTLGRGLAGMARSTIIAVDDADLVPAVVAALADAHARDPIIGPVSSILDAVPPDQDAKLRVLAKLRADLAEATDALSDAQRRELAALRPPDDLRAFTAAELPAELRAKVTERDGRIGYLIAVTPGGTFDEWNGHDLVRFASAIRELHLPGGRTVTTSGPSVIFADIIMAIRRDGVIVTAVAALALVVMIVAVVGRGRRTAAVLAGTALGSLAMIAVCAVVGLRVNFLDFVALPITLGLGIDYAINIAHRALRDDPRAALHSTGGSVLVCSLTTMIGYASLLVSSSVSIRGFGLASLIGEITCVLAALAVVPSLIALGAGTRGAA